ncbi:unnamed protein product [Parascedosporium putredinis]|uniref:Uncharacterized protein n=1 Tax=Parascedosporium putredinis TaxID=1442378 RepID=A0A9P1M8Y1_9PEZI|nr:unnamed protein product [Parascedosporium putredinis]CAI7994685.1 unnamed protein product [Parascedosporium putredinis]
MGRDADPVDDGPTSPDLVPIPAAAAGMLLLNFVAPPPTRPRSPCRSSQLLSTPDSNPSNRGEGSVSTCDGRRFRGENKPPRSSPGCTNDRDPADRGVAPVGARRAPVAVLFSLVCLDMGCDVYPVGRSPSRHSSGISTRGKPAIRSSSLRNASACIGGGAESPRLRPRLHHQTLALVRL